MSRELVLDGGVGHRLKQKGLRIEGLPYSKQFLAGVVANAQHPRVIEEVHGEYLQAGADVVTTNSFSATPWSLTRISQQHRVQELAACGCAKRAIERTGSSALVAGSLPPLTECYRPPSLSADALRSAYDEIAKVLTPHVDVLLCETLSSLKEAEAAAAAGKQTGLPVWVSFTLEDNTKACLRSGEDLKEATERLIESVAIDALLVNCCAPQSCTAGLERLQNLLQSNSVRFGCYANGFLSTTSDWLSKADGKRSFNPAEEYGADGIIFPEAYGRHVQRWKALGATIVGGCCGTDGRHVVTGVVTDGVRMSLNPFCEIAVEEAIRLKEQSVADEVSVVSIGSERVQDVLRTALAMGADRAVHVKAEDQLHPLFIARILKELILMKEVNLVILGKQAIDDDYNQTGQILAGLLKWPQATFASRLQVEEDGTALEVHREVDGGLEHLSLQIPAVITTDLRLNAPRYTTLPRIMKAKREKIETLELSDLPNAVLSPPQIEVVEVQEPPKRAAGVMVKSVTELVEKLRTERKVL